MRRVYEVTFLCLESLAIAFLVAGIALAPQNRAFATTSGTCAGPTQCGSVNCITPGPNGQCSGLTSDCPRTNDCWTCACVDAPQTGYCECNVGSS